LEQLRLFQAFTQIRTRHEGSVISAVDRACCVSANAPVDATPGIGQHRSL